MEQLWMDMHEDFMLWICIENLWKMQQIFGVTMHTYHTLIKHPNHQIGYITMTKTVKGTKVNAH